MCMCMCVYVIFLLPAFLLSFLSLTSPMLFQAIKNFEPGTRRMLRVNIKPDMPCLACCISHDNTAILTARSDGAIIKYSSLTGQPVKEIVPGVENMVPVTLAMFNATCTKVVIYRGMDSMVSEFVFIIFVRLLKFPFAPIDHLCSKQSTQPPPFFFLFWLQFIISVIFKTNDNHR